MDKEELEKFDKDQLDILLNDLQDIDKFTGFKNGSFKYELGKYQASLLVNCIKKQKEIIDETINAIDLVIELIKQQPTKDDRWILDRLNGFKIILEYKEVSE